MIIIYNASDIIEAQLVAGLLESNGIEAHVGGHYLQGGIGELAPMNFATISVEEDLADKARRIIDEYEGNRQDEKPAREPVSPRLPLAIIVLCVLAILALAIAYG